MEIGLIAIDVDGTLLDDHHQLPAANERAVRAAVAAGVQVVLATGRSRQSCVWLIDRLELQTPGIYVQGLNVTDGTGQHIHGGHLDPQVVDRFLAYAEPQGLSFIAYTDERITTTRRDALTDLILNYSEPEPVVVKHLNDEVIHKLIVFSPPENAQPLRSALAARLDSQAVVLVTQPEMVEIMPAGTSKGRSLRWLAGRMDIPMRQVMAIGNGENDVEMLQLAGVGVAVANAAPSLLEIADFVVGRNDQAGVSQAIARALGGVT